MGRAALPFTLKPAPLLPALHNGKLEKNKWRERERERGGKKKRKSRLSPAGGESEDRGGETQLPNYGCVMFSERGRRAASGRAAASVSSEQMKKN